MHLKNGGGGCGVTGRGFWTGKRVLWLKSGKMSFFVGLISFMFSFLSIISANSGLTQDVHFNEKILIRKVLCFYDAFGALFISVKNNGVEICLFQSMRRFWI